MFQWKAWTHLPARPMRHGRMENPTGIFAFSSQNAAAGAKTNKDAAAFSALCIYERIAAQVRFVKPKR